MKLDVAPRPSKIVRNAEASRAKILDAARIEFVTYGLSGGRVDRIAEASGVNKNLIYHYFGSKDALYLEVLERIYADLRARQQDEDLRELPPVEGMKRLVSNTFDHFVDTPDLIRLMSIENIHYAEHLKNSRTTKQLYGGLLDTIRILLKRGQEQGVFRGQVDPIDLYLVDLRAGLFLPVQSAHVVLAARPRSRGAPAGAKAPSACGRDGAELFDANFAGAKPASAETE